MKKLPSLNEFLLEQKELSYADMWQLINPSPGKSNYAFRIGYSRDTDESINLIVLLECAKTEGIELVSASPLLTDRINQCISPVCERLGLELETHSNPIKDQIVGDGVYFVSRLSGDYSGREEFIKTFSSICEARKFKVFEKGIWKISGVTLDPSPIIECLSELK
jgi:hypothetical protein